MRISLDIRESNQCVGEMITDLYVDGKLIFSDDHPTPYQILFALCNHIPGLELDPLVVTEYFIYAQGEPV